MLTKTCIAGIAVLSLLAPAWADDGDQFRGKAFAQQLCSGCHAIEKDQAKSPLEMAPPFAQIAKSEKRNAEVFANWLGTLHPSINGIAIKPVVASDLLAYIHTLAPQQQAGSGNPPQH
jgi:mono/diheme cytochrome c family protein